MTESSREFFKMSGSGNDFVFFETENIEAEPLAGPSSVRSLCIRETGLGGDGVVFLDSRSGSGLRIRYFNSDGSLGELCGNATLCATRLAYELGIVESDEFPIRTDSGVISARVRDGLPDIDLAPVTEVRDEAPSISRLSRESCLGFARAGVPHLVIV
ncbi:MAG TPA: hypothetical protein VM939_12730, partial [Gemmatimonadaceae bacterium]|nr:hypothetical protein [Gemmatimonadaceae bacterium]